MWAWQRFGLACAFAQDSLHRMYFGLPRVQSFFIQTTKTPIRLVRCTVWFESSLGAHVRRYVLWLSDSFNFFCLNFFGRILYTAYMRKTRSQGYKTFFMLNSAEHEFFFFVFLINLKLLIIANSFLLNIAEHGIFSANEYENANYCWHFHIYWQRKFHAQVSWAWKKFYNLGPDFYQRVGVWFQERPRNCRSVFLTNITYEKCKEQNKPGIQAPRL